MRTITREELEKILINHQHWLKEDCEGWENMRARLDDFDLDGASLVGASLVGASLSYIPLACPDTGGFIAWKKAGGYIIKLYIPSDARRLSATGRKCRCDKATVVAIENKDGTPADVTEVHSDYDSRTPVC